MFAFCSQMLLPLTQFFILIELRVCISVNDEIDLFFTKIITKCCKFCKKKKNK